MKASRFGESKKLNKSLSIQSLGIVKSPAAWMAAFSIPLVENREINDAKCREKPSPACWMKPSDRLAPCSDAKTDA